MCIAARCISVVLLTMHAIRYSSRVVVPASHSAAMQHSCSCAHPSSTPTHTHSPAEATLQVNHAIWMRRGAAVTRRSAHGCAPSSFAALHTTPCHTLATLLIDHQSPHSCTNAWKGSWGMQCTCAPPCLVINRQTGGNRAETYAELGTCVLNMRICARQAAWHTPVRVPHHPHITAMSDTSAPPSVAVCCILTR